MSHEYEINHEILQIIFQERTSEEIFAFFFFATHYRE
jgi:hypothetical protein